MLSLDLDPFVARTLDTIARAALAPGVYRRSALPPAGEAEAGVNEYGVADAANLLYTLGHFPRDAATRGAFVESLRSFQNSSTGLYVEATHHPFHCTAHCLAALELFDASPRYALTDLQRFNTPAGIVGLLEGLDWTKWPWAASHQGAGVFAAFFLTGELTAETRDAYFGWLDASTDPATGLLRRGHLPGQHADAGDWTQHLGSTFHYVFNYAAARRPLPRPAALVDACLDRFNAGVYARTTAFIYADWVYCLSRGLRQSGHRFAEAQAALRGTARVAVEHLTSLDPHTKNLNDLHTLFGVWCALAELQTAVPGLIRTTRPLKLVLDRRPFI